MSPDMSEKRGTMLGRNESGVVGNVTLKGMPGGAWFHPLLQAWPTAKPCLTELWKSSRVYIPQTLWVLIPGLHHSHWEDFILCVWSGLSSLQLVSIASCLFAVHLWEESGSMVSVTSLQAAGDCNWIPPSAFSCHGLKTPFSSAFPGVPCRPWPPECPSTACSCISLRKKT